MKPHGSFEADLRVSNNWFYSIDGERHDTGVIVSDYSSDAKQLEQWSEHNIESKFESLKETVESDHLETSNIIDESRGALSALSLQVNALSATCDVQGRKLARIAELFGNPAYGTLFKDPQNALETVRCILIER